MHAAGARIVFLPSRIHDISEQASELENLWRTLQDLEKVSRREEAVKSEDLANGVAGDSS
jgi:hypothetical protein